MATNVVMVEPDFPSTPNLTVSKAALWRDPECPWYHHSQGPGLRLWSHKNFRL